jgi:hypothetical protein
MQRFTIDARARPQPGEKLVDRQGRADDFDAGIHRHAFNLRHPRRVHVGDESDPGAARDPGSGPQTRDQEPWVADGNVRGKTKALGGVFPPDRSESYVGTETRRRLSGSETGAKHELRSL